MTSPPQGPRRAGERFRSGIVLPLQAFISTEVAGGVALLVAAIVALVWANVAFESYYDFWHEEISFDLIVFSDSDSLQHWVNDGLMVIFFFVVGLEIKRELLHGELAEPRLAALPAAAALGGMVVPAAIYLALNLGTDGQDGWGIPMATDIAFAVGVLALVGKGLPSSLRVFLLALAIVDDIGAILVIAVFYTESIQLDSLAIAAAALGVIMAIQMLGVKNVAVYLLLGVIVWAAVYESGVHATLAGVILGLLTPGRPYVTREGFAERSNELVRDYRSALEKGDEARVEAILGEIEETATNASAPLERLERMLHPWSSFLVVPVFALANAGIEISGGIIEDAFSSRITVGVFLGLLVGKVVGICGATWLATRLRLANLPAGVRAPQVLGVGLVAGIGFTVSLFISELAFDRPDLIDEAKIGILSASVIAGVLGFTLLRIGTGQSAEDSPP